MTPGPVTRAGPLPPLPGGGLLDVVVVGAGVVGAAIARRLSQFRLAIALVDAAGDVGAGTSKANTAILHTGFDATPGSLEARLVSEGYHRLRAYAADVGIAVEVPGALLVAWDAEQHGALPALEAKAVKNGYRACRPVDPRELRRREPHLGPGALGALEVPGEGIIDPWGPPIAFATEAVANGASLHLRAPVTALRSGPEQTWTVSTARGDLHTRFVVNAAGLHSDTLDHLAGHDRFGVVPRRGELIVFDALARPLVNHVLLPVPSSMGKGVLVSPTVFGNVLLGPTAEDLEDRTATGSSEAGLAFLLEKGRRILPALVEEEVTAVYAGLRAATEHPDYQVYGDGSYVCVGGIRSTGLTSSLALAEHVLGLLADAGLPTEERADRATIRVADLGEGSRRPYLDPDRIAADPDTGRLVCHCEQVSRAELVAACRTLVPAIDVDGLRRRTRALTGRCQGFFCGAEVAALLARETRTTIAEVLHVPEART